MPAVGAHAPRWLSAAERRTWIAFLYSHSLLLEHARIPQYSATASGAGTNRTGTLPDPSSLLWPGSFQLNGTRQTYSVPFVARGRKYLAKVEAEQIGPMVGRESA